MPAHLGNKYAVNNKGGGRKGYEFEIKQQKRMQKVLDKDLTAIEKLQNSKEISPVEKEKLNILQARVLKIYDKLHATKTKTELSNPDGNLKTIIINKSAE